jgi:phage I-like protein
MLRAAKRLGVKHQDEMSIPQGQKTSEGYKRASALSLAGEGALLLSTSAVAIDVDGAPEWIELIPAGKFSAVDGRGPFENLDPDSIVAASIGKMPQVGLVLDYDHSTDLAAPEGRPAPAAGWLKQFKVEQGAIFARIEWTADAAEAVKGKKYRYVSPVFEHDKDGKVARILRAALTNNPALVNLPAIASAQAAPPPSPSPVSNNGGGDRTGVGRIPVGAALEPPSSRIRKRETMAKKEKMAEGGKSISEIVAGLEDLFPEMPPARILQMAGAALEGDGDDSDEEDEAVAGQPSGQKQAELDPYENENAEQMAARQADEMAKCANDGEKAEMAKKHAAEKERFARRSSRAQKMNQHPHPSLSRNQAGEGLNLNEIVAKHPMMVKMATDLNQMRLAQARKTAESAVDNAIREGRLVPSQREWAIEYCAAEPKGFERFIGAQPKILQAGPDGTFTGRIGDPPADALTRNELMVCDNLGVTAEKFAAAKKARLSHNVHLG